MMMMMMKGKGKGKGNGNGKGYGKGGGGGWNKAPKTISKDMGEKIDTKAKYTGKVEKFNKFKGYGWIKMSQTGLVPGDSVYVYYKSIESEDRFPQLVADMEVEFGIHKYKSQNGTSIRAKHVSLPGGRSIAIQDELDARQKAKSVNEKDLLKIDGDGSGEISELEYLTHMLVKLRKIDADTGKNLHDRFVEIDVSGDGTISAEDVEARDRARAAQSAAHE